MKFFCKLNIKNNKIMVTIHMALEQRGSSSVNQKVFWTGKRLPDPKGLVSVSLPLCLMPVQMPTVYCCICCKILHGQQQQLQQFINRTNRWQLVDLRFSARVHDTLLISCVEFLMFKIFACLIFMVCHTHKNIFTQEFFTRKFSTPFFLNYDTYYYANNSTQ